jgi:hypothetical protein
VQVWSAQHLSSKISRETHLSQYNLSSKYAVVSMETHLSQYNLSSKYAVVSMETHLSQYNLSSKYAVVIRETHLSRDDNVVTRCCLERCEDVDKCGDEGGVGVAEDRYLGVASAAMVGARRQVPGSGECSSGGRRKTGT